MDLQPTEITKDSETGVEIASFKYTDGILVAKQNLKSQTTNFDDIINKNMFLVCCGEVMMRVRSTDYQTIDRRVV